MKTIDHLLENDTEILSFLRSRYPLYHLSNVFFRDIQYGIRTLLENRGVNISYTDAERLAQEFVARLEKKKILVPIDKQSWVLYYDDFKTKPVKRASQPVPAAKPAPAAKPVERPAGGLPPLKSSAVVAGSKPAGGLPPLKSAAPVAAKPAPVPQNIAQPPPPAAPEAPRQEPVASTPAQEQTPVSKPPAAGEKKALPPIRSSVPVGSKK